MFHLFKKVYLDFDDKINMSYDRVICSQQLGGTQDSELLSKVFYGELIATGKHIDEIVGNGLAFPTFLSLLEELDQRVDQHNSAVFIYCDKASYYKLAILWMKIVTPHNTKDTAWKFFKSHIFKEKNFTNSRFSSRYSKDTEAWTAIEAEFTQSWETTEVTTEYRKSFKPLLEKVIARSRVEFLLAGYFYDGRYAAELAAAISPLVKKDLEKFLYEHKEIILVHFQRPQFQEMLGVVNGPYTFDNFYDMVNDPSPLVKVMFNPSIWGETRSSMYSPSSGGTINLSAISDEDINLIKQYSVITGKIWTDEQWYTVLRSEIDKFNFIKMFRNKNTLSVDELNAILEYELHHQNHAAGAFYAIDLRTVNTYFVDFVLQNTNNKELLKPYAFELPN